ncbi:hypothetical protein ACFFV7_07640 [Nonomuraea spiralis]|uniref:Secreted protein n=1 Tax=Nonomuraea spiralis TaxID=46182 RepID=A0ABV5IBB3_9ACTN|nr:hypothetical protein [Nonomuraea spiralis]
MSSRSAVVLAGGTANAVKLFVAALAFTSAYVGFSAYNNAGPAAEPARTVTLSAREVPITAPAGESAPAKAGEIALSAQNDGAPGCGRSFLARSLLVNPRPGETVLYRWRLSRWSPAAKAWRTYLMDHSGFAGAGQNVEWQPQVSGNPGWYRVELVTGSGATVTSERFQVSC